MTLRVLGPGSLVGEMGLVDQSPARPRAPPARDVDVRHSTRDAVEAMIDRRAAMAAKLLLSVSAHMAERLRNTSRQLKLYATPGQCHAGRNRHPDPRQRRCAPRSRRLRPLLCKRSCAAPNAQPTAPPPG